MKFFANLFVGCLLCCAWPLGEWRSAKAEGKLGPVHVAVEIFVTSWCPYCKKLEHFLQENDIEYTRYDIEKEAAGASLYKQLGGGGVPLMKIGSTVLRGFDEAEIEETLSRYHRPNRAGGGLTKTSLRAAVLH